MNEKCLIKCLIKMSLTFIQNSISRINLSTFKTKTVRGGRFEKIKNKISNSFAAQ